ncbi:PrsW family intramembrane metalloprotease [Ktedonosporobacter rubrisoli]|uniref:PrsW family intramembrane metalloprotease n=1 Tax=Ktedonosporobacter rubrisoli TaxID=2509675 RepID=A0A4P6K209_KTERU|nr:PrsW family glutamic-type intramembrane protease [Ktedonosporobacter rubrisoli]QBD81873.1 PrsW family intramembrane metalloprotease [Ktedonosporobacter rubrisoli]
MSQNYGVLRVVRICPPANAMDNLQDRYPTGWLPDERLVHLLTRCETTIGRALSNEIILMDPTVSREHARLVLDERGWHIFNLTLHNTVRVNGRQVPSGSSLPLSPQDFLVLGSTILQLIAPQHSLLEYSPVQDKQLLCLEPLNGSSKSSEAAIQPLSSANGASANGHARSNGIWKKIIQVSQIEATFKPSGQGARVPPAAYSLASTPPLPEQPEPEMVAHQWKDNEENLLGAGITMQFALPQRLNARMRWLIAGAGVAVAAVLLACTLLLSSLIGVSALQKNGFFTIVADLTIPLLPAIAISLLVDFIDRYEREPWFLRLAAFFWGAIIAIPTSLLIEQNVTAFMQNILGPEVNNLLWSAVRGLNAGIAEETVKGLGVLLLFVVLRDEFDNVTDGIIYGALIGAGFAMVEDFIYFLQNPKDLILFLFIGRIVLGWLCHSTFTVCFGAALGYVRHTRVKWRHIAFPLIGYLCAVGLHSVFDFISFFAYAVAVNSPANSPALMFSVLAVVGDYIPPFITQIILIYFLIKSLAHEAAVIREFLASEVSDGIVKVNEYALLQNSFQRTKEERRVLRRSGFKQWMRVKALYQTEIGLAFRKWHVSMGDKPKLGYRQPEDAYRQRIKHLRQEIAAAEAQRR